ncbi:MAG TPA: membrane protein insertase YidC [Jatrophihabitans sp.]|nr:membrane protein insertase YidC [Jatrophihabitans sp.]
MLDFLYTAVSWVLLRWYQLFTALGMSKTGGLTWALSIVMLVVTARLVMFRFFIKQVHYQRRMQEMQPKIKKLQEKHKGDRAALNREMMALQQSEGFNPISGCLPMFLQIPVFIALFHVLKHISNSVHLQPGARGLTLYGFTEQQTHDAATAKLFGAPLAASLHDSATKILDLGGDITATRVTTIVLVLVSAAATFITQRAVMANQTTPPEGQAAMIQKLMQVGIPISVLFSGFIFPLGVLLYWFTSNLWTMLQQFYILRYHPHTPGAPPVAAATTEAAKALGPKVGQKPVHPKGNRSPANSGDAAATTEAAKALGPKAGQKPVHPKGNRGPANSGDAAANRATETTADAGSKAAEQPVRDQPSANPPPRPANRSPRPSGSRAPTKRAPSKKRR